MSKPALVLGYDGSESAQRALDLCMQRAALMKARIHVVHVMEWSAYSFLTPQELDERSKERKQEIERAEAFLAPALDLIRDKGVAVSHEVRHGHAGEVLCEIAQKEKAAEIFVGRTGGTGFTQRLLGSLVITLVQASPVPVTVVP